MTCSPRLEHHLVPRAGQNYRKPHCQLVRLHARQTRSGWYFQALKKNPGQCFTKPLSRILQRVTLLVSAASDLTCRSSYSAHAAVRPDFPSGSPS